MEVLELDGKRYLKAAAAAKELGYTSDYVGQLCRSGKIDAHLVGRSWYVNEESIRAHKSGTHRSTKAKTKAALKEELEERAKERHISIRTAGAAATAPQHFYSKLSPRKVKYDEDRSELIPVLSERKQTGGGTKIDVRLADAEKLKIAKSSESYELEATERPHIRFSGDIDVTAAEEPQQASVEQTTLEDANEEKGSESSAEESTQKTTQRQVDLARRPTMTKRKDLTAEARGVEEQPVALRRSGVVAMTRAGVPGQHTDVHELTIHAVRPKPRKSARATFLYLSSSLALALILVLGFLLIDQSITSDSVAEGVDSRYRINLSNAIDAIERLR